ncbi:MAG: hypothetical protein GEV06_16445 [Luteitalea sp.]|nr:hypothetical protein [Luteitalea sp.]
MNRRTLLTLIGGSVGAALACSRRPAWSAAVAAVDITPAAKIWMAGYAARTLPSQGVAMPLHAKALALEDEHGTRAVLVTADILGFTTGLPSVWPQPPSDATACRGRACCSTPAIRIVARLWTTLGHDFVQFHGDDAGVAQAALERRYRCEPQAARHAGAPLPAAQPEPVQIWRLGDDVTLVALGGEVVVDYALRLKRTYGPARMWVAGYSNDVFAYVPSRRVLEEGGYEGGGAMIYYGKPSAFAASVEERIYDKVGDLMRTVTRATG